MKIYKTTNFLLWILLLGTSFMAFSQDRNPGINTIYPEAAFASFDADGNRIEGSGRVIDVTRPPFNATGDGITDDTEALNDAYTFLAETLQETSWRDGNSSSYIIYFPEGTYLVSNTILHRLDQIFYPGNGREDTEGITWVRFVGQNRENTIIKLKDNSPGFEAGADKEVISFQKENVGDREGNNIPAASQLSNLTINIGSGNPGAIGASYISANTGQISNIKIISEDGQGTVGLSLPFFSVQGYYRDIVIEGFDYGIRSLRGEVNPTFEYVTLKNQNIAGILANDASVIIRKAHSINSVPFAIISQDEAHVIVLESTLEGGNSGTSAIELQTSTSQLFVRNTQVSGYQASVLKEGEPVLTGNIDEYVSDKAYTLFEGFEKKTLNLEVADSPIIPWEQDLTKWANVDEFPGENDVERIQNALNSGLPTVYFPKAEYKGSGQITIPATVKHIDFLYSRISSNVEFVIDEASDDMLYLEHTNINRSTLLQTQPRPTLIRNASFDSYSYTSSAPSQLFLESSGSFGDTEDFCPPSMKVWGRSINNEIKLTSCFKVRGGSLWVMGYKTEGEQSSFDVAQGGNAEIFGGLRNETNKPIEYPFVLNENSNVSFMGYNFLGGEGDPIITEIQDGLKQDLLKSELPSRGGRSVVVPLYIGKVGATVPRCLVPTTKDAQTRLNSATINWETRNPSADGYEVRYRKLGIDIWETITEITDTTTTIESLEKATNYEWEVRTNCGDEFSEWSPVATFTTDITVKKRTSAINVNGILDEESWGLTFEASKRSTGEINNTMNFDLQWDAQYLYVAAKVLDDNLFNDSDKVFQDDAVEIFIDGDNSDGSLNAPDNQIIKGYNDETLFVKNTFNGEILHATTNVDGGYVVEMAIPWSGLGVVPGSGINIGFDIGNDDDDNGGDDREGQQVWSGSSANFNNTQAYGDIILQGDVDTEATLALHYTWDGITTDLIRDLESNFSEIASFSNDAVKGSNGVEVSNPDGTVASNAAIAIPNGSLLNQSFGLRSYSIWFKARNTSAKQILFEEGGEGAGVGLEIENDSLAVSFRNTAAVDGVKTIKVPFTNDEEIDWNHLAVTFENGIIGVYLNGNLANSGVASFETIPQHNNPPSLGGIRDDQSATTGSSLYLDGFLDEFKVFNGVLTAEQVAELAVREVRLPPSELSLYFPWDDTTEDQIAGVNSSLENFAAFSADTPFGSAAIEFTGNGVLADGPAVSIANGSLLNSSFEFRSYSIWIKANDTQSSQVIFEEGGDQGGVSFELAENGLTLLFRYGGGGNLSTLSVPYSNEENQAVWNHLAVTFASGTITAYINGENVGTKQIGVTTIPQHNNPPSLGGVRNNQSASNNDPFYFDGFLDEFKVYEGILTEEEIAELRAVPQLVVTVDTLSVEVDGTVEIPTPNYIPFYSQEGVVFTSNNPEIATVDENGLVTGISSGTAIIEVASQFNPEAVSTVEVTVEGGLSLGDCEFEISDFVGATEIVAINEVTYRSFERNKGTYVIGIAAGIRTDGQAGAWEIHSDCSVKTIRRTGQGDNTTLLPDVKGVEKYRGWNYVPTSISEDGQFIYATAINQNGFAHKRGWTVEAGTEVEVRFQLGGAFYGRIFGVSSEILCDDLNVETFAGNYFVTGCNDGSETFSTQSASSNETLYQVYPNPVNNSFSLNGTSEANNLNLQVFDLTGNLVLSTLVGTSQSIDATRLNPGVYLVKIYQDGEEIVQTKLVKK
ncbi:LamG-like jellyroll fold domain-containing protein [Galbibacter mesophilus]|uniref:LamG-like jellyroll fold domain-containing protein n=1 Tax=Galbibacter mesophilus TaxID=379069 RepID=UPI00191E1174|nr:LamG-like jellyroll fold domain-containing protein [Galbibacter mesophilus]MCM5663887.1 T9SS type A sorting domain-containing protein [Galbibacter mesophilus]